nr:MAG TPA: hypothetical protein [Caudoviricetes sp.]
MRAARSFSLFSFSLLCRASRPFICSSIFAITSNTLPITKVLDSVAYR